MEEGTEATEHYIIYSGKHVALAAMQRRYIQTLMPWINNPITTAGVLLTPPVTYQSELSWYDSIHKDGSNAIFAILVREDPGNQWRYVGHTGLHHITWPDARASSGTLIGDRESLGKGYGTEAKLLLLYHAFYVEGLRKITSELKAFNGHSLGHLLKTGYKVVGISKSHHFHEGMYVDEIMVEIFKQEFDPIWKRYKENDELPSLSVQQKKFMKKLMK
jgi:RimJ/RimL family protein N-acetyltransferase